MSTNYFTSLADDASLNLTTFNTIAAAIDGKLTDMDDGTHNFSGISVANGNVDAVTLGGATPDTAAFADLTVSGNMWGPAWDVTMGGGTQSINDTTTTTVQFDTEVLDSNSDFNTGTYTLTPTVEGYYLCFAQISWATAMAAGSLMQLHIVGTSETSTSQVQTVGTSAESIIGRTILHCNGSTDTILVQVYHNHGSAVNINGNAFQTFFHGWRVE